MKKVTSVLSVLAAFLSPLILSCSDDNNVNPVYDLRTLSRVFEEFASTTESRSDRMIHKKPPGICLFDQIRTLRRESLVLFHRNPAAPKRPILTNIVATPICTGQRQPAKTPSETL